MALIYIPCLNVDAPDNGVSFAPGIVPRGGAEGGIVPLPGITISSPNLPFTFSISPFGPALFIGINFKWWADLFGLGETRIQREKEEIQDVLTPIFRFLHQGYGFPLRDGHALQFSSDHVEAYMRERPDLDFLRPSMYQEASVLAASVFVDDTPSTGQRKRIVNQFLANAADNQWPTNATIWVWRGLIEAANKDCRSDPARFMRNPLLIQKTAQYAALLHYMPLANFASAISEHKFNDHDGRKIVTAWMNNPQLVAGIPQVLEIPPWAVAYRAPEDGGGQSGNPYETQQIADRAPIQELWQGVLFNRPWYPDLIYLDEQGLIAPTLEIPPAQKPPDWDRQDPPQPWPGDNVVEIPPVDQSQTHWPQYPDCPPWNQRPQPDDQGPGPQPDPDEQEQPDDHCDPDCQVQIDYLKERVQFIDNWLVLGIIPRLENLEDWLRDIEHRLPGPMPFLPNPNPFPPWFPPPPTDPGDIDPTEVPPTEGNECDFTEIECDHLKKLADPSKLCGIIRNCERELICEEVPFCDETGGPWGGMTECWQNANVTPDRPVAGAYAGGDYPAQAAQLVVRAYQQAFDILPPPQGSANLVPLDIEDAGRWDGPTARIAQGILDSWKNETYVSTRQSFPLPSRNWIFSDPANEEAGKFKYRTVALRADELDPCTGEPPQTGTLPRLPDFGEVISGGSSDTTSPAGR